MFIIPEGFQEIWFNDLDVVEREKWGGTLKPSAVATLATPIPENKVDPKAWSISYLVAVGRDLAMPEAFQKFLVEQARGAGAQVESVEMKSGHFVQISHMKEVAEWISVASA